MYTDTEGKITAHELDGCLKVYSSGAHIVPFQEHLASGVKDVSMKALCVCDTMLIERYPRPLITLGPKLTPVRQMVQVILAFHPEVI